ncbi:MAG TPA: adenylate/guanylate cyclase domain-containing protein [Leptospiraceae bacterium]|nr:adenylate/guanylate cyclase domain-containing protein [Leptospiraceae bacterium]HMX31732.1 adenylate/guanylate cyclase domain-containing protein [Leptospiraceae bacterium]HMY30538.1 adenylate/guanylate cyclase domain-containing protein [Leptospiraceae bacterium]HMZ64161.1 adenylate/guanylate cyclase domain-containing protein [Leptospiraceae bacterium]HNA08731.1 adenylate/guanylate cyclase domain-containing protein [Leptospiraceae bacterium]
MFSRIELPQMNLRIKILIGSLILSLVVSVLLAYTSFKILQNELYEEYRDRLIHTSDLGSQLIDQDSLQFLISNLSENLSEEKVNEIQKSKEFLDVYNALNSLRNSKPDLIQYVYIWVSTDNPEEVIYLADADVLRLLEKKAKGETLEDISTYGSRYSISAFPEAKNAFKQNISFVEKDYRYDAQFHTYSISGYSPIKEKKTGKQIAVLGVDMTDTNIRTALKKSTLVSAIIGIITVILTSISSLLLGNLFVKPILELNKVVLKFGEKDFSARANIETKDEVGLLSDNFNNMAETIVDYDQKLKQLLDSMKRFVPFEFLNFLDKQSIIEISLGDQVYKEMTIFFSDIRSFTKLSESMTPKETFNFINSYLKRMGPLVRENKGFIDKYIGDSIMAIFPTTPDYALLAGIAIRQELKTYNAQRANNGYAPIHIGVGIHTGNLMLGTIGEVQRMDTTVIADSVNLASRIEGLTKYYGVTTLITETTKSKLINPERFHMRFIGLVQVVGKEESVPIYEVFDGDDEKTFLFKIRITPDFEQGMRYYIEGNLREAHRIFKSIYLENNSDLPSEVYLRKIKHFTKYGLPSDWNGVDKMSSK